MNRNKPSLFSNWKLLLSNKRFRIEILLSLIILVILLFSLTRFLLYVEEREGVILPDPILALFKPIDLSWLTFTLIYFVLVFSVIRMSFKPVMLLSAIQIYMVMIAVRIISMFLMPLNPPPHMIPLTDPLVEIFGTGKLLTKDLFFSGHTATLFLLFLVAEKGTVKTILLICTLLVALFVIMQHVHYSIDVFAALFFTYCCYALVRKLRNRMVYNEVSYEN